ncbi:MAG: DUF4834 domain-containing protein [Pedobacter sp.]|nr:MAG: DUF4834 domain-containing protein [Pedobacter sp.]
MAVLQFIFATILILYILRLLVRLVLPLFLQRAVNKMSGQFNGGKQQKQRKPEGSISIDYMPPQAKPGKADKLGDFVDYEEVK